MLLEPDGDGTHLRLIHSDLPSAESAEKHGHGWRHYPERLAVAASRRATPAPDRFGRRSSAGAETDKRLHKEAHDGQSDDVVRSRGKDREG